LAVAVAVLLALQHPVVRVVVLHTKYLLVLAALLVQQDKEMRVVQRLALRRIMYLAAAVAQALRVKMPQVQARVVLVVLGLTGSPSVRSTLAVAAGLVQHKVLLVERAVTAAAGRGVLLVAVMVLLVRLIEVAAAGGNIAGQLARALVAPVS
jgi:hypothetical protein